MTLQS